MTTNNAINSANPIRVASGGTGNATQAAYSLVAGGTTTTGAFQAVGPNSSSNAILYSQGSSSLPAFSTSGTPYVSGISFDSGSNTLNSYTNNTFTPSLQFGGGSTGMAYVLRTGKYWKIGAVVYFTINIALSAKGSSTGNATIAGLPFTSANDGFRTTWACETNITFPLSSTVMILEIGANSTSGNVVYTGNGNQNAFTNAHFTDVTTLFVSGFYWTA